MTSAPPSTAREPFSDGVSLVEFLACQFRGLSPASRKSWVRGAARFYRESHDTGIKVGAALITTSSPPWRFASANPAAKAPGPPLSRRHRWVDLAELLAEAFAVTRRGERFLFLRAYYARDSLRFRTIRPLLRRLEEMALDTAARKWRLLEKACLRPGGEFVVERSGSFRVIRRSGDAAEAIVAVLLPDPDQLLRTGESRSDRGSGCVSVKVFLGGRPYFLKRYDCRGALYRLKNSFRRSRAMRVWTATWGLLARGIATPEPLVLLEERHGLLLGRSYILSSYQEGAERMMVLWPGLSAAEKVPLAARCAILLGRMHAMNMVHGDTNWDNILVCGSPAAPKLVLVDLDGCKSLRRMSQGQALRDIHHFIRDLLRERNQGEDLVGFFIDRWARWLRPRQKRGPVPVKPFQQLYRGLK
jgi:tRNA A-37 threonylcarbamoyl transferase component Bud32